ncbi:MAG: hypothetical protein RLZZ490_2195 [Cyanobacteriota bacterium]
MSEKPLTPDTVSSNNLDNSISPQTRDFIQWIKTNRPDLVAKARNPELLTTPTSDTHTHQTSSPLTSLAFVDPKSLHGPYHVTPELKKTAHATAVMMTTSNWIDIVGNAPLFFFTFQSLTALVAFLMTIALSVPILVAGNAISAVVAQGHKGRWKLMLTALAFGLVPLNVLQTVATGIGIEVLNNQSELTQIAAGQALDGIVASKEKQLRTVESNIPRDIQECRQERKALETMPRNTSAEEKAFQSRYVRAFGTFASQSKPMTRPLAQLPLCVRANQLEQAYDQSVQQLQNALNEFNLERAIQGNDLAFLKQVAPSQYNKTFVEKSPWFFLPGDPTVEVRSGVTLVALGTQSFMSKVQRGDWHQLGLNLFCVGFSAITSLASIGMGVAFTLSEDTQKSYDDRHKDKMRLFFQQHRMNLTTTHDEQQSQLENFTPYKEIASPWEDA